MYFMRVCKCIYVCVCMCKYTFIHAYPQIKTLMVYQLEHKMLNLIYYFGVHTDSLKSVKRTPGYLIALAQKGGHRSTNIK